MLCKNPFLLVGSRDITSGLSLVLSAAFDMVVTLSFLRSWGIASGFPPTSQASLAQALLKLCLFDL